MTEAFDFIIARFAEAVDFLDSIYINPYGFTISLMDIFSALLILGFVVAVFWKGARV